MKYENIKRAKLSHKKIAEIFGYKNVNSFRFSSKHKIVMQGINEALRIAKIEWLKEKEIKDKTKTN